jgi:hypothetical protein
MMQNYTIVSFDASPMFFVLGGDGLVLTAEVHSVSQVENGN